jgi:hypothetical protein
LRKSQPHVSSLSTRARAKIPLAGSPRPHFFSTRISNAWQQENNQKILRAPRALRDRRLRAPAGRGSVRVLGMAPVRLGLGRLAPVRLRLRRYKNFFFLDTKKNLTVSNKRLRLRMARRLLVRARYAQQMKRTTELSFLIQGPQIVAGRTRAGVHAAHRGERERYKFFRIDTNFSLVYFLLFVSLTRKKKNREKARRTRTKR